uniref:F-box domain-containing protein n=1 Tax=Caenorhabditis tropicalis TaxID=1561998 RepID=A0A1I7TUP1_9PELO
MTAFPLFHLPLVAMEHVLSMMNPYELINLSKTSSRTKRAVKSFSRIRPKFRIDLGICAQPDIVILGKNESWEYSWTSDQSEIGVTTYARHEIIKFSKNPMEELKKMYDYIKEVLRCPLENLYYALNSFPSENKSITDWLRSQHESIHFVEINCDLKGFDDDLKYLVSSLKISGVLSLMVAEYKENFRMEIPESPYCLSVNCSSFIGYEQFLKLKHSQIVFVASILTDKEINRFLKSWMSMESHLELKVFKIRVSVPEAINVIMDLPHEVTTEPSVLEMLNEQFKYTYIECGYNIKRSDGKMATVCIGDRSNLLHMIIH